MQALLFIGIFQVVSLTCGILIGNFNLPFYTVLFNLNNLIFIAVFYMQGKIVIDEGEKDAEMQF